jgi:hypothetical protein
MREIEQSLLGLDHRRDPVFRQVIRLEGSAFSESRLLVLRVILRLIVAFRAIHPSIVLKMVLSQSAAQLPNDVRWCFSSSDPSTCGLKVVILLHVSRDPWQVSFILVLSCAEVLGVFVRRKSLFLDMSGCSHRSITVPYIIIANSIAQPLRPQKALLRKRKYIYPEARACHYIY